MWNIIFQLTPYVDACLAAYLLVLQVNKSSAPVVTAVTDVSVDTQSEGSSAALVKTLQLTFNKHCAEITHKLAHILDLHNYIK